MPLTQRVVQPIELVRAPLNPNLKGNDELQHVNMNALVGIIRQLASLSAHAETLFADLFNEASKTMCKARLLETKVRGIGEKVNGMSKTYQIINLNLVDGESRYTREVSVDQNVVIKDNRTPCVRERYSHADVTPPLHELDNLWDVEKKTLHLYTDPHYFGKVWMAKMQQEFEKHKKRGRKKSKKGTVRKEPRPITTKKYEVDALGKYTVREAQIRQEDLEVYQGQPSGPPSTDSYPLQPLAEEVLPPPLQPPDLQQMDSLPPPPDLEYPSSEYRPVDSLPAPLPPPDEVHYDEPIRPPAPMAPPAPPAPKAPPAPRAPAAPAAPPAPGGVQRAAAPAPPAQQSLSDALSGAQQSLRPAAAAETASGGKPRNMLDEIQGYSLNTLKKVTVEPRGQAESHYASMDVMAILSRRPVMQWSDTESEDDSSDQEWDGDN